MFHLYGLLIGSGIVLGLLCIRKQVLRLGFDPFFVDDLVLWIAIPAIIGARVYHILTDWQLYAGSEWISFFQIWKGGLGFFGALLGGILGVGGFVVVNTGTLSKNNLFPKEFSRTRLTLFFFLLDLLSFGAPLAQAVGRIGNLVNQELYGLPTTLPWAIWVNGQSYHPLFAYEAICTLFLFFVLNWFGWKKKLVIGKGQYVAVYGAGYALIRFWLEFLRIDTAHWTGMFGIFSIAQWMCVCLMLVCVSVFWLRRHADRGIEWEFSTLL